MDHSTFLNLLQDKGMPTDGSVKKWKPLIPMQGNEEEESNEREETNRELRNMDFQNREVPPPILSPRLSGSFSARESHWRQGKQSRFRRILID